MTKKEFLKEKERLYDQLIVLEKEYLKNNAKFKVDDLVVLEIDGLMCIDGVKNVWTTPKGDEILYNLKLNRTVATEEKLKSIKEFMEKIK